jgi:hypothetical protein
MRAIFEALGAKVSWDEEMRTVTSAKDDTTVVLQIGQDNIFINGTAKKIDTPAVITGDRTMVPLRAVSEAFECVVDWNGDTRTVDIKTNAYNSAEQSANPVKKYSSVASLNVALDKFSVSLLTDASYVPQSYQCYNDTIAEINYKKGDSDVNIRTALRNTVDTDDISGIYGGEELEEYKLNQSTVTIYRYNDTLFACWICGSGEVAYVHSASLTNGTADELKNIVEDTEDNHTKG